MGISIYGEDSINGEFIAPSSKPQTQRALIMAALSDGTSTIRAYHIAWIALAVVAGTVLATSWTIGTRTEQIIS